jgi:hypothetical protein
MSSPSDHYHHISHPENQSSRFPLKRSLVRRSSEHKVFHRTKNRTSEPNLVTTDWVILVLIKHILHTFQKILLQTIVRIYFLFNYMRNLYYSLLTKQFDANCSVLYHPNLFFSLFFLLSNRYTVLGPTRVSDCLFTWLNRLKFWATFYPCNRPWSPIGLWDVEAPTFSWTIGS